jgi:hypothetical protein
MEVARPRYRLVRERSGPFLEKNHVVQYLFVPLYLHVLSLTIISSKMTLHGQVVPLYSVMRGWSPLDLLVEQLGETPMGLMEVEKSTTAVPNITRQQGRL